MHHEGYLNVPYVWQVEELGAAVALCGSVGRLLCLGTLLHHPHHCSPGPHQCKALPSTAFSRLSGCQPAYVPTTAPVCLSDRPLSSVPVGLSACLFVYLFVLLSSLLKSSLSPVWLHSWFPYRHLSDALMLTGCLLHSIDHVSFLPKMAMKAMAAAMLDKSSNQLNDRLTSRTLTVAVSTRA